MYYFCASCAKPDAIFYFKATGHKTLITSFAGVKQSCKIFFNFASLKLNEINKDYF